MADDETTPAADQLPAQRRRYTVSVEPLTLRLPEVAELLGVSARKVTAMNAAGQIPQPIKFGGVAVWPLDELRAWLHAGAPERTRWEAVKAACEGKPTSR